MQTPDPLFPSPPLQLGFIGGSLTSAVGYAHQVAATMDNHWQIAAGAFTRDHELNQATGKSYGVATERCYERWQDMLLREKDRLDAIVILTPTPTHGEVVTACLQAGFPVICEKALATTSAEGRRIQAARDETKGFLAVTYNYSGYPMVRELRNLIRQGRLGKILHFQAEMPQEGFIRTDAQGHKPQPQSWRLKDGAVPTIHLDLAVHLHHLVHFLTDLSPLEVVANQASYGWFSDVVDDVICLSRYQNDVQGQIWFSKSSLGYRNGLRLRIFGDQCAAEWYQAQPEEVLLSFSDGHREILDRASSVEITSQARYNRFKAGHPAGFLEAFGNLYVDIARCLQTFKQTGSWQSDEVFSAELAIEGLSMLEAMVESVKTRKWQAVTVSV